MPLDAAWSSPFARWQGPAGETNSVKLAGSAAKAGLARSAVDLPIGELVLGQTVPQRESFYGPPYARCSARADGRLRPLDRAKRRLFMTATPRFYTPRVRSEAGQLDVDIASMNDETVFGPVLHRLTFGAAIERDLLSDYQVVVVAVD